MSQTDIDTTGRDDLATTTLAEIYAEQGLHERALEIYERLAERAPRDPEVRARIEALSAEVERATAVGRAEEGNREAPHASPEPPVGEDAEFERWLESR